MSTLSEREGYKKALTRIVEDDSAFQLFKTTPVSVNQSKFSQFFKKIQRTVVNKFGLVRIVRPKRFASKEAAPTVDKWKRRRISIASAMIVGLFVALRQYGVQNVDIEKVFFSALIFSVIGISFLVWIFWGELTIGAFSVLAIFAGSSLFAIILFIQLFFLRQLFGVDEILSFIVVLGFLFMFSQIMYLSANLVNVSRIRIVPILQVAQTVIYIMGIINTYFLTLGLLTFSFDWYFYFILFGVYTVFAYPIIFTFGGSIKKNLALSAGIGWVSFVALAVLFLWPVNYKIASIYPTMVFAASTGILMNSFRQKIVAPVVLEYCVILGIVLWIIFSNSFYF